MSKLQNKKKVAFYVLFSILAIYGVWWKFFRIPGPDEIAQRTVNALAVRDYEALMNLTMPEELEKLHITREGVQGILSATVYSAKVPDKFNVKLIQTYPVDQLQYDITPANGNTGGLSYPWPICITQAPNGRWYLPLGYMLLNSCLLKSKSRDTLETTSRYVQLCEKYGILGVRLNTGGYGYNDPNHPKN